MKKLFAVILISIPMILTSQEISKEYLESLPEEIRNDILERIDDTKNNEKDVYRSIDVISDIEKLKEDEIDDKDQIFGSEFFRTMQTSFMPINLPNPDNSYILDFGDVLQIQLVGQNDSSDSYSISRDGSINLSDIGKLYVGKLTLENATKLIESKISEAFIGTKAFITLANLKDITILVSGNAQNPGVYTLNGSSNMLHALHVAGGINEFGSYRNIRLIRDDETISNLDIYDILISGKLSSKNQLRSGDIIFVEPRENEVVYEGAFNRPMVYELKKGQNLQDGIKYANGVSIDSDLSNIFLYRLLDSEVKSLPISNISQLSEIESKDKDRVFVRQHSFREVQIEGAVLNPGTYTMIEGENLFDLIEKSGGYSLNAYPEGAVYINQEAKKINKIASEKLYEDFLDGLLEITQRSTSSDGDYSSLFSMIKEIKDTEAVGRVIVDLLDDSNPVLIKDDDYILIPEKNNSVFIYGEILNEGSLLYKDGEDIKYYINESSGLKPSADRNSIYVLYPNGRTKQISNARNIFASEKNNTEIYPGSIIYVPRKIDNTLSNRLTAQAYATIIGNLGVTLASLSVLKDQ